MDECEEEEDRNDRVFPSHAGDRIRAFEYEDVPFFLRNYFNRIPNSLSDDQVDSQSRVPDEYSDAPPRRAHSMPDISLSESNSDASTVGNGGEADNFAEDRELLDELQRHFCCFSMKEIRSATQNFSFANKIGQGGFGPVYKGVLPNGCEIAVKRLSYRSSQGKGEFFNELRVISSLQHPNVVRILGFCAEGNNLLLVYELAKNGSLDRFLFDSGETVMKLDWKVRCKLCLGIAKGLAYLHRLKLIHRDIKPSNILLDVDFNAKISDFGLVIRHLDESSHICTRMAGTIGYISPEYGTMGHLTEKVDVFSYGIVILETVSGNHIIDNKTETSIYLLHKLRGLRKQGNPLELVDPRLCSTYSKKEALELLNLSLMCTTPSPKLRPTMSKVVSMLEDRILVNNQKHHSAQIQPSEYQFLLVTQPTFAISEDSDNATVGFSPKLGNTKSVIAPLRPETTEHGRTIAEAKPEVCASSCLQNDKDVPLEVVKPVDVVEDLESLFSVLETVKLPEKEERVVEKPPGPAVDTAKVLELKRAIVSIGFRHVLEKDIRLYLLKLCKALHATALPHDLSVLLNRLTAFLQHSLPLSVKISVQDDDSIYVNKYDSTKHKVEETKKRAKQLQQRAMTLRASAISIKEQIAKLNEELNALGKRQSDEEKEMNEIRRTITSDIQEITPLAKWLMAESNQRIAAGKRLKNTTELVKKGEADWASIQAGFF